MSTPPRPPSFLGTLFDATFERLLRARLVRALYLLSILAIGTYALVLLLLSFNQGVVVAVFAVLLVPPLTLLLIVVLRTAMEALTVLFRMGEQIDRMSETLYTLSTYLRSDDGPDADRRD